MVWSSEREPSFRPHFLLFLVKQLQRVVVAGDACLDVVLNLYGGLLLRDRCFVLVDLVCELLDQMLKLLDKSVL